MCRTRQQHITRRSSHIRRWNARLGASHTSLCRHRYVVYVYTHVLQVLGVKSLSGIHNVVRKILFTQSVIGLVS
jgi:hypothetical protein